ncbi:hypothetical protein, partial [Pseudomonas ogarae]|uniref:hypothetical protein n=1 Tax=Pseudomonas ogarae (strain DSM 112162 / CECT 30235 / F113) TaxID=1114970 RepID=UPI001142618E
MAQRGYPGIHAGMPTAQYLRSASVVNGVLQIKVKIQSKSKSKSGAHTGIYVAEPPLSRASSLPQGNSGERRSYVHSRSNVGASSRWHQHKQRFNLWTADKHA